MHKKYPNKNKKLEDGFLLVANEQKPGNATWSLGDNRQVSALKYTPREQRTIKGNTHLFPASWKGLIRYNNKTELVDLDEKWVVDNFETRFIEVVKHAALKEGHCGFLPIPEGDSMSHKTTSMPFDIAKNPKVRFRQTEGERTCLFKAAASAFWHLGGKYLQLQFQSLSLTTNTTWKGGRPSTML